MIARPFAKSMLEPPPTAMSPSQPAAFQTSWAARTEASSATSTSACTALPCAERLLTALARRGWSMSHRHTAAPERITEADNESVIINLVEAGVG